MPVARPLEAPGQKVLSRCNSFISINQFVLSSLQPHSNEVIIYLSLFSKYLISSYILLAFQFFTYVAL